MNEQKTIVISGCSSLGEKMKNWRDYWERDGKIVLAWPGYIGPGVFAEISFRIGLNLTLAQDVPIILLNIPSADSPFHDDIMLWNSLGWVRFYKN